jgi:hypothetical protein
MPGHEFHKLAKPYCYVGNSGEVRATELARNDPKCPAHYHYEVERLRGSVIGLDPRFTYCRWKPGMTPRQAAAERVRLFDEGAAAEQIFTD